MTRAGRAVSAPTSRPRALAIAGGAFVLALAAAGTWWLTTQGDRAAPHPIVLISIDTLRADHLPLYGYKGVATPAIDQLGREGAVFDRAYAHSPQTLPSHASILSGRLPFEHGVRDNVGFTVKTGEKLLAAWLRERGYATAGFVSAYVLRKETGIGQGFEVYDSELPPATAESSIGQVQRSGPATLAATTRWLSARADPRFFLFFHIYEPHKPYHPPRRYGHYPAYDGEIAFSDEVVGALLRQLRDRGWYDAATIILLSDHGEGLGDHGEQEHGLFLYNETIRVPLVVKLPAGRSAGRRVAFTAQLVDLVPTVLDLAGVQLPAGLPGRSLRPILEGAGEPTEGPGVYSEAFYARYHFGWSELQALTDDRYRYIRAPREELYDLREDPGERNNLAPGRPQARAGMRAALGRLLSGASIDSPSAVSDEDRQRLAALGYVGAGPGVAPGTPGETLADPKDKVGVLETYRRASELAGRREYFGAIPLYRRILQEDPGMADVWLQLAQVLTRTADYQGAAEAYRKALAINPGDPGALIGASAMLLRIGKLDEAKAHAELAVRGAPAGAHELLAKIALARRDVEGARREAELAQAADPGLPLPLYIKGLVLYREGKYEEALACFQGTIAKLNQRTLQLTEVHFYAGDSLARLERHGEAEVEFQREIELFPNNTRARASLAMLYRSTGRDDDAARAIDALVETAPTQEGFGLAVRLWTLFGEPARAQAVTAEARRRFGAGWKPPTPERPGS